MNRCRKLRAWRLPLWLRSLLELGGIVAKNLPGAFHPVFRDSALCAHVRCTGYRMGTRLDWQKISAKILSAAADRGPILNVPLAFPMMLFCLIVYPLLTPIYWLQTPPLPATHLISLQALTLPPIPKSSVLTPLIVETLFLCTSMWLVVDWRQYCIVWLTKSMVCGFLFLLSLSNDDFVY